MNRINYCPVNAGCGPSPAPTVAPVELHACMGLNACKGHDPSGKNNCAGTGICATAQKHGCAGSNNCHNQGGCGSSANPKSQSLPGFNDCASKGGCAVPIPSDQVWDNTGEKTWMLARKLFEERMDKARRTFGPAPIAGGPGAEWLASLNNESASCGRKNQVHCSDENRQK